MDRLLRERERIALGPADGFRLHSHHRDALGQTHGHFDQLHQGVRVWGGRIILHTDREGRSLAPSLEGLKPHVSVDTTPAVDLGAALSRAIHALELDGVEEVISNGELVIYPEKRRVLLFPEKPVSEQNAVDYIEEVVGYRLAWHVRVYHESRDVVQRDFLFDAQTGDLIQEWNSLQTQAAVGTGFSRFNGVVELDTFQVGPDLFEMRDVTRAPYPGIRTYDAGRANLHDGAPEILSLYSSEDNHWGDSLAFDPDNETLSVNGQTAAVDAHYGSMVTWDYYLAIHGREGIDGKGTPTYNRVHVGVGYNNAFWNDNCFCMSYGDGAHRLGLPGFDGSAALDVAGHEFSHGVTFSTAGLVYNGESGALNEATSDIFGTMVEFWERGGRGETIGNVGGNWMIGEEIIPNRPLRWMDTPSRDGNSVDAWFPGIGDIDVHFSSGPMNRAFFFLSQGALPASSESDHSSPYLPNGMTGIGNDAAAAIWYRALTVYLYPDANYVAARTAALRAAGDLHGDRSPEVRAVENAFAAVNVGYSADSFDDRTPPVVAAAVHGAMPALVLSATATDNVGIAKVNFLVDGVPVGSRTTRPFELTLGPDEIDAGTHELRAIAFDLAGNHAASEPVSFAVTHTFDQLLSDPSFENGADGWILSEPGDLNRSRQFALSGNHAVVLGLRGNPVSTLAQVVDIPASATSAALSFWLAAYTSQGEESGSRLDVIVIDEASSMEDTLASIPLADLSPIYGQVGFDLLPYAGRSVRILLRAHQDTGGFAYFLLDEFALRVLHHADTTPPHIELRSAVHPGRLVLIAHVFDESHVEEVELAQNGLPIGAFSRPFIASLPLDELEPGTLSFSATALDQAGNEGSSNEWMVVVPHADSLLENGDFEDLGPDGFAAWNLEDAPEGVSILDREDYARTGEGFLAFFRVPDPVPVRASQVVQIPNEGAAVYLRFWAEVRSDAFDDGSPHHLLTLTLRDQQDQVLRTLDTFSNLSVSPSYRFHQYDLSEFRGETVALVLEADLTEAPSIESGKTHFLFDDMLLQVLDAEEEAPLVSASMEGSSGYLLLQGTAEDASGVARLEFWLGAELMATRSDPIGPQQIPLDSRTLPNGSHTLTVRAYDIFDNMGEAEITFEVWNASLDTTPPEVSIQAIGEQDDRSFAVEATDDIGISKVELYLDGAFLFSAASSPIEVPLSELSVGSGSYLLEAVAYDFHGNQASDSIEFEVQPPAIQPTVDDLLLLAGGSQALSVLLSGTNTPDVVWEVAEGASCGQIDASGNYTAPSGTRQCTVVATSTRYPTLQAFIRVRVYEPDLNRDGLVDGVDLGLLASCYDGDDPFCDLDGDGVVDDGDAALLLPHFGWTR